MNSIDSEKVPLFNTGIPSLDDVIKGVRAGDNIVWQVDSIQDYIPFVHAFCKKANQEQKKLVYFRFAQHQYLLPPGIEAEVFEVGTSKGFELFIDEIFNVIEEFGFGACYVFDCLSDLAVDWYSDVMLANFFMLTCPYLFKLNTATYFALIRNHNALHAIKDIHSTAQVVIDCYRYGGSIYVHPLKVENRHSSTMYMLHKWDCKDPLKQRSCSKSSFNPVLDSVTTAEILSRISQPWLDYTVKRLDQWSISFRKAKETLSKIRSGEIKRDQAKNTKKKIIKMAIARSNDKRLKLANHYFNLEDLLNIGKRMIGTGLIGGKTVGMLLAQAILRKNEPKWKNILETHDSFFVGSYVFYTYLVKNDCWWLRRKLSDPRTFLKGQEKARERMLKGNFSNYVLQQFKEILNYYGQAPIIVRSSSIQEDAFGNAFAGKYESIFLANQGDPEERLEAFLNAVRKVYSSSISKDALHYRKSRGLLELDEQMALLVQRVSGSIHGDFFYPLIAGVGFSFNPFVWDPSIDPKSGFLRLVAGLGTRAVDRTADDYTRLIALNKPNMRPEKTKMDLHRFSQQKLDLIDFQKNSYTSYRLKEVVQRSKNVKFDLVSTRDYELEYNLKQRGRETVFTRYIDFNEVIEKTNLMKNFRTLLSTLEHAYNHPVDVEFTVNFDKNENYKINLLQCRTFQVRTENLNLETPAKIQQEKLFFKTNGPIIGTSVAKMIDRLIYIVPEKYGKLSIKERYSIARLIGKLTKIPEGQNDDNLSIMIVGPGRWGTESPSLGVPVSFAEIKNVSFIGEIAEMHEGLIPDVSLGSHFFNDLVELDMLYFALHPRKNGNVLNRKLIEKEFDNSIGKFLPESEANKHKDIVKVIEIKKEKGSRKIYIHMNSIAQFGICYFKDS